MKKYLLLLFVVLKTIAGFAQITSFSPTSATPGTTVTITGTNLAGINEITFGGVKAAAYKVVSPTSVTAVVPVTTSGDVAITSVTGGTFTLSGFTYIPSNLPTITSVAGSNAGTLGSYITILGVNLRTATSVSIGGVPALSFAPYGLDPDRALGITVGLGASGDISVTNPSGTATLPGFIYTASTTPYVTSVVPSSGPPGTTITINGYNLGAVSSVVIGEVPALSFNVTSPTSISAVVGAGYDNIISFTGVGNSAAGNAKFTITGPTLPIITSFSPTSATPGTTVTITGTNLAGTNDVSFGGIKAAAYKVVSPTSVTAVVPVTTSGNVSVTNTTGTVTVAGFTYIPSNLPTITAISGDMSSTLGRTLTIVGINLRTATSVTFGGVPALNFAPYGLDPDHALLVTVGLGASGNIVVTNPSGTATVPGFTYTPSTTPYVTSVVPSSGPAGTPITINGYNLGGVSSVTVGEVPALSFSVILPTSITAVVGPGYGTNISFTGVGNSVAGNAKFTITATTPVITSFSPTSATPGTTVTITGTNLAGINGVKFGGVTAAAYKVISPTSVTAVVPVTTSGDVAVTEVGGATATLGGFTYIPSNLPTIISFSSSTPSTLGSGITIIGINLRTATSLTLGGVPVLAFAPYSLDPDNALAATVGLGASGDIVVTTPSGIATLPGFVYTPSTTPYVTSVVPSSGPPGTTITINGYNLGGVSSVNIGEVPALSFSVILPTSITAVVGPGYDKIISFTGVGNSANGNARFTITAPAAPGLTSFTPTTAGTGTTITITGTNLAGITGVSIGGVPATSFTVVSPTSVTAVVGAAASGNVVVTTTGGTATLSGFVYNNLLPTIAAFSPPSAPTGTTITVTGTNFTGATAISFGGVAAKSFTVLSPTTIIAVLSTGASGSVSVNTPQGTIAASGFTFSELSTSNFNLQATSVVCRGGNTGSIKITAVANLNYTVVVTGPTITNYTFTNTLTIPNLAAGSYSVCIGVAGTTYQQCFTAIVTQPKDLAVYTAINKNTNTIDLTLDGGNAYNIKVNGVDYATTAANITLPLALGTNNIEVSTDKPCQGIVSKRIIISDNISAYPNPFGGTLSLNLGDKAIGKAQVQIYNAFGKQVFSKQYSDQAGEVQLDLAALEPAQVYILKLTVDNTEYINKIIKK
jgi:hypothetical protein